MMGSGLGVLDAIGLLALVFGGVWLAKRWDWRFTAAVVACIVVVVLIKTIRF
jgi:hypothetical protein